jgi:hypothetical protein
MQRTTFQSLRTLPPSPPRGYLCSLDGRIVVGRHGVPSLDPEGRSCRFARQPDQPAAAVSRTLVGSGGEERCGEGGWERRRRQPLAPQPRPSSDPKAPESTTATEEDEGDGPRARWRGEDRGGMEASREGVAREWWQQRRGEPGRRDGRDGGEQAIREAEPKRRRRERSGRVAARVWGCASGLRCNS